MTILRRSIEPQNGGPDFSSYTEVFPLLAGQQSFKIEPSGGPPGDLTGTAAGQLTDHGLRLSRVVNGVDFPLAELWHVNFSNLHRTAIERAKGYQQLREGELLGLLRLPQAACDFSLQEIPAGTYFLRYTRFQLEGVDSEGEDDRREKPSVPNHDFAVLTSVQFDINGQSAASGEGSSFRLGKGLKKHPLTLALLPPSPSYGTYPYTVSDDTGHCAVQFKTPVRQARKGTRELPVVILVVNPPDLSSDD